jgi:hypoxanthine-guanine phosphoribosyltransferase
MLKALCVIFCCELVKKKALQSFVLYMKLSSYRVSEVEQKFLESFVQYHLPTSLPWSQGS